MVQKPVSRKIRQKNDYAIDVFVFFLEKILGASVVPIITPVDIVHCDPVQDGKHPHIKEFPLLKQDPPFIHGFELHGGTPNRE